MMPLYVEPLQRMVENPKGSEFIEQPFLSIDLPSEVFWESEVDPSSTSESGPLVVFLAFDCPPYERRTYFALTVKSQHM